MKKLVFPFFLFVQFAVFAQNTNGIDMLKDTKINNNAAELQTTFISNDDMAFNSTEDGLAYDRKRKSKKNRLDSYVAEMSDNGELIINDKILKDPNLKEHNGMLTYSKDGKTVFFSVNRKIKEKNRKGDTKIKTKNAVNLQLFKAEVDENGEWVNLEMLPFNSNHFSTGQPVLNEDDTKLYFVSDGPESMGRTDIFVVDLYRDGTYGKPLNMGPKVNSTERDIFPFIDEGNVLFFASDVQNKQGDLDVFVCKIFDNTISNPMKLKVPVNLGKEDIITDTDKTADNEYFSSNRQVGKGKNDIYAFAAEIPIIVECQQEVSGIVKNVNTHELLTGVDLILFDEDENRLDSFLFDKKDATFSFNQSCNTTYTLKGYFDGDLVGELDVKTVNDLNAEPIKVVMNVDLNVNPEAEILADVAEENNTENQQDVVNEMETSQVTNPDDYPVKSGFYNFNSTIKVYTVQVGAYRENVQAHNFVHLTHVFTHKYADGLQRYYTGVFESSSEARAYLELVKKQGHNDAFIVGLHGEDRF